MKERLQSGKMTINWSNVDYVEVVKDVDCYTVNFLFRPKIKTESLKVLKEFKTVMLMRDFFKKERFFEAGNYFINSNNFSVITEDSYNEKTKKNIITFYMRNAAPLELEITRDQWATIKNTQLM